MTLQRLPKVVDDPKVFDPDKRYMVKECYDAMNRILAHAEGEGRPALTAEEDENYKAFERYLEAKETEQKRRAGLAQKGRPANWDTAGRWAYHDQSMGGSVRSVAKGESLFESFPSGTIGGVRQDSPEVPSLGAVARALLTGDWDMVDRAGVVENQDAQGGVVVPAATAGRWIDNARAMSVLVNAGAQTIPLPAASEFGIGRVETDATCYWRQEGEPITPSNPTFTKLIFHPHVLGCLVPVSVEWLEDVANGDQLLQATITGAMAVALDQAGLRGTGGGGSPTGIRNTTDVQTTTPGAAWTYNDLIGAQKLVWDENGPTKSSAVILSPASEERRQKFLDGNGSWIPVPPAFMDVPFLVSTSVPDTLGAGSASDIYLGDWTRVLIGMRTNLKIEVLNSGQAGSYNATTELYRWIRVYLRADIHCEYEKHISILTGVVQS